MNVKMLQSRHLLGTNVKLYKGCIYYAEPATNQPNYKEEKLYFVYAPSYPDTPMLCTLDIECRECHCWDYLPGAKSTIECAVDSHAGVYAPQEFISRYGDELYEINGCLVAIPRDTYSPIQQLAIVNQLVFKS